MSVITIGIDEVGRGALIGNVVTAATYFPPCMPKEVIELCADSKKLSPKKREYVYELLVSHAHYSIGEATPGEIDEHNILGATLLAMKRAFESLAQKHPLTEFKVCVDGNKCPQVPQCEYIIGGDALVSEISAASIIAKVTRDRQMVLLDAQYPEYGLKGHKGYPSKQHLEAIQKYGVCKEYRKSYAPVQRVLQG